VTGQAHDAASEREREALLLLERAIRRIDEHVEQMETSDESFDELNLAFTEKRMALAALDEVRRES
jgi:hypothetical protein